MYLQKVISKKPLKKPIFCWHLVCHWRKKQDPDSWVSDTDPRIRIRTKMSQIHNTGLNYPQCPHYPGFFPLNNIEARRTSGELVIKRGGGGGGIKKFRIRAIGTDEGRRLTWSPWICWQHAGRWSARIWCCTCSGWWNGCRQSRSSPSPVRGGNIFAKQTSQQIKKVFPIDIFTGCMYVKVPVVSVYNTNYYIPYDNVLFVKESKRDLTPC